MNNSFIELSNKDKFEQLPQPDWWFLQFVVGVHPAEHRLQERVAEAESSRGKLIHDSSITSRIISCITSIA